MTSASTTLLPLQLEEQQTNRSGWLFARGAFDKGDLLYLRDEEERLRHSEQMMEQAERDAFAAARQRVEEEEEEERRRVAAVAAAARSAALRRRQEDDRKRRFIPIVKVKPAAGAGVPEEDVKRQRLSDGAAGTSSLPEADSAGEETAVAAAQRQGGGARAVGDGDASEEAEGGGLSLLLGGYGDESGEESDKSAGSGNG